MAGSDGEYEGWAGGPPRGAQAIRQGWSKIGLVLENQQHRRTDATAAACVSHCVMSPAGTWAPAARLLRARGWPKNIMTDRRRGPAKAGVQSLSAAQIHRQHSTGGFLAITARTIASTMTDGSDPPCLTAQELRPLLCRRCVCAVLVANSAVEVLRTETDVPARSVASELWQWSQDRERMGPRDLLIIDQASTLGTAWACDLLAEARTRGTVVVLLGDHR
jgi:hypothetical protein